MRVRQASYVLTSHQEDVTILLCLKSSKYYTLDEVGTIVWDALKDGATCEAAVEAVLQRTVHDRPSTSQDIARFVAGLSARRLVVPARNQTLEPVRAPLDIHVAEERQLALPSVWLCAFVLFVISLVLPRIGIERAWRLARARTPRYRAAASPDCFHQLAHRVAFASTLCPLRSECLEQSLFILWWMRRQRMLSELCLGALQFPFKAHAWVESAGVPVNDHPDRLAHYRRFQRGDWEPQCSQ